jgi:hypothetical protein
MFLSPYVGRLEDRPPHVYPVDRRQLRGWTMPTERDGVLERCDKNFAIRADSQMPANLPANLYRQFVIDVRRQLTEQIHAVAVAIRVAVRRRPRPFL